MEAKVTWKGKMSFEGESVRGFTLPMDTSLDSGGEDQGFRPIELLLVGLGGCTGMDVISILKKKQQVVTGFEVNVSGERSVEHPRIFTHIMVEYVVKGPNVDPAAVARSVELSQTKYCAVMGMLSKAAKIEHTIRIVTEEVQAI